MSTLTLPAEIETRRAQLRETVAFLRERTAVRPRIGIILGSGLGDLAQDVEGADVVPYATIPHFCVSTAPGHAGKLIFGELAGQSVMVMAGRFHTYEGYTQHQVTWPVRVMKAMGAETLFVSCATGGLNPAFKAGDLMLISDHLNLTGSNPLIGPNDPDAGPRFPVMFDAYRPELRALAKEVAASEGINLQEGVYAGITGPAFFSPAELRYLMTIGADAIGMSTVPEVIVAVQAGLKVLGLALVSDMANPDLGGHATEQEILAVIAKTGHTFRRLAHALLPRL